jgi:hypothetical protein
VALITVGVTDDTAAAAVPIVTAAPAAKFDPLMFIDVPPAVGPELGLTELMVTGEEVRGAGVGADEVRAKSLIAVAPAETLTVAEVELYPANEAVTW